jgi:hypothetical protein
MKLYTLEEYESALHLAETQRNNALAELSILRGHMGAIATDLRSVIVAFPNAPGREDVKRATRRLGELSNSKQ